MSLGGIAELPAAVKLAIAGVVLALVLTGAFLLGGIGVLLICLAGIVLILLLLIAFRLILAQIDKRKSNPFLAGLSANSGTTPQGISDPSRRARLDDLNRAFSAGIERFKSAGKNLYALPWYIVVGEPGSGKTEAIRHSNIGFPPGMQDELQGAGGTLNMNWWFANQAVLLDTAGRLMFEEVQPGETSEWQEFLKLLRSNRATCPINGMFLVLPVDSLIKDTAEQLEGKARRIATQL
ncbi:MAG: type VI secretion protein IcmF/TssM N-terminal domain-containing protein, partial [Pseudomonadota bacterium]